ncbi:hypothetical protein FS749_005026 [Ceratobasidium sp. UAMH 11750]|nr:hypothetical protein FS749_005026 [Ceratobasidium sp. UAMH 11750]
MGGVTTYCQLSGCSPEGAGVVEWLAEGGSYGPNVLAGLLLLANADEVEGQRSLSVIGPLADDGKTWLELDSVKQALALPEGRVRVVPGCSIGDGFELGFCDGPEGGPRRALVSSGPCFFVLTVMLPILEAATSGRVSPQRLWNLAMMKGRLDRHYDWCLPDVKYGLVERYWDQYPWMWGDLSEEKIEGLEAKGSPGDIAEIIRSRGHWVWMRPDRFPIKPSNASHQFQKIQPFTLIQPPPAASIATLPTELLHSIALHLPLSDIVSLAAAHKAVYNALLGGAGTRDILARSYMRLQEPWYLPYGEAELKWWHERDGDDALGWEYLRQCCTQSHSMRNRKRIWKAAESIEEECESEERARAMRGNRKQ